jgi:hypothetical protein
MSATPFGVRRTAPEGAVKAQVPWIFGLGAVPPNEYTLALFAIQQGKP